MDQWLSKLRALPFYYAKVRRRDTMSLGNRRCGFYSERDVYRTSDLSCKGSIVVFRFSGCGRNGVLS